MGVQSLVFGVCPWCLTEVRSDGIGGMEAVEQRTKNGSLGWWHQGCLADLSISEWKEVPDTGYTHDGGEPL